MNQTVIYVPGQRWVSDTESDLGLGMITEVGERSVTVSFAAGGETRVYAMDNAPLSRVRLAPGEVARSRDDWELVVDAVQEHDGLLVYTGQRRDTGDHARLPETELDSFLQFADAKSRLLNGQIDTHKWFELRLRTHAIVDDVQKLPTYGLHGARVSLIPHQLFIADEVASRFAPRVLLADEVGLGKTIEACLILHKQLLTGRARRILIVVPDALVHQWLVELMRRFNLRFSLFDRERCDALRESEPDDNPFETEQLILTSYGLLANPRAQREVVAAGWDMLVVDEAHHLEWDRAKPSDVYVFFESLTARTPGVLLLTATPEQLGEESHFARLRLLDPDRFTDFDGFMREQLAYRQISAIVDELSGTAPLSDRALTLLQRFIGEDAGLDTPAERRDAIRLLIDRHGPSRVLFRNTRSNIPGFPARRVHPHPLVLPDAYAGHGSDTDADQLPFPELRHPGSWTGFDPRVGFIRDRLRSFPGEKFLVICAHAQTVIDLEQTLRNDYGILAAVFHENMSMVARDRGAHFFAAADGSRVLICSEIGSEGRNFQFAHHLLLFDLPLNPDVLEQRIGRLDRIGQTREIQIHVPYFHNSPQQILFRWYHEGMNAFATTCPVGQSVFADTGRELLRILRDAEPGTVEEFLRGTHKLYVDKLATLEQGRDRLLEISSFDPRRADALASDIRQSQETSPIKDFLEEVFDVHGVIFEDKDADSYIVRPGEHMHTTHFPSLAEDGATVTFTREFALAHEDIEYLSFEHPLSRGAMDMILTSDHGKTAIIGVELDLLPRGTLLVEGSYVLELIAPNAPELRRFLDRTALRLLVDESGRDLTRLLTSGRLFNHVRDVDKTMAQRLLSVKRAAVTAALAQCTTRAKTQFADVIASGRDNLEQKIRAEHRRLAYLKSQRASVREEEIEGLEQQRQDTLRLFSNAQTRLDAVRLIVTL